MLDPIELQGAVVPFLLRIVGADDLDKLAVARAAAAIIFFILPAFFIILRI